MTLRIQIALALGVLAAIAAASAAFFSYASIERRLETETDTFLSDRIAQVTAFNAAVRDGRVEPAQLSGDEFRSGSDESSLSAILRYDAELRFYLPDGTLAFAVSDTPLPITQAEIDLALSSDEAITSRQQVEDRTFETRLVAIDPQAEVRAVLQVGRDISGQLSVLEQLRFRLFVLAAAVVAAACAIGYFLAGRLTKQLEELRLTTREIAQTKDFSRTIEVQGTDEIADVATDFNLMLTELESSVSQQRRLVQDAGHELRTPLSTLRASVELSQRLPSDNHDHERDALLNTALDEVDELSRLVDELVNLAAFPFDGSPVELLNLDDVVGAAVDMFRQKRPHRIVEVDVGENQPVHGKHEHLVRAVSNVLANADKFSPEATIVDVSVATNRITVSDRGPGIPREDLERIFDKFYRSPTVQTIQGSGLGLAFVADVVRAHGGTVSAQNGNDGGAVIVLAVPPATALAH